MRAARYYGKEDIRIEEIPEQPIGPGQIKITPAFVGICGSDLHEYIAGPSFVPTKPHPVTGEKAPITLGHEFSGKVKEIGDGVSGFEVGQNVVVQPTIYCSNCGPCKSGIENTCHNGGFIGLHGGGGGLSDAVVVPARAVLPIPDNVPLDVGALVEPLSVAWHAVSAAKEAISPDAVVLILGGGPIGLAVLQCLLAKGVKAIIVSEVADQRKKFAADFGAHHIWDPMEVDVVVKSRELSNGHGPDVIFDCAGVPASLKTSCDAIRSRGIIINIALWEHPVPFHPNWLIWKEASYLPVLGYQRPDFEAVINELGKGTLKPHGMITKRIQLENVVEDGFKPLIHEKDKNVKILVEI